MIMGYASAIEEALRLDETIGITDAQRRQVANLLAVAGWRPPARVVTTVAELDALTDGAVVIDTAGFVGQCRRSDGPGPVLNRRIAGHRCRLWQSSTPNFRDLGTHHMPADLRICRIRCGSAPSTHRRPARRERRAGGDSIS